MKKQCSLLLAMIVCFSLIGCGRSTIGASNKTEKNNNNQINHATPLAMKELVTVSDKCEFQIEHTDITYDVIPPQPDSWYSHYEAADGKTYVDICFSYKNLSTKDQGADEIINATLIYDEQYQYTGFSIIEKDNRSDFTYSNITSIAPLSTEYLHYLFEVPADVENSNGSLVAILSIEGTEYKLVIREGVEGEASTQNENTTEKTKGEVKQGEMIGIANKYEFCVDYSNITDDVVPPQPGDWFSHYEAADKKVYVDFCIAYKNQKTKNVSADDVMSATLTYAGKYEYNGFSIIEKDNRGDFTYSNITSISPLTTEYLHYLFEVPEEISTSSEPLHITFTIDGNTYSYNVR